MIVAATTANAMRTTSPDRILGGIESPAWLGKTDIRRLRSPDDSPGERPRCRQPCDAHSAPYAQRKATHRKCRSTATDTHGGCAGELALFAVVGFGGKAA